VKALLNSLSISLIRWLIGQSRDAKKCGKGSELDDLLLTVLEDEIYPQTFMIEPLNDAWLPTSITTVRAGGLERGFCNRDG
jgi:hypothetical protein